MKPITEKLLAAPAYPVITAHSGCEGTAPNSIEHVRAAIASGAEMLEIDIRPSGDTLYLSHDEKECYDGCPTLAECFALVAETPDLCVNCDVKITGLTAPVTALAAEYGLAHRIVFTGYIGDGELPALAATDADWWLSLWRSDRNAEQVEDACARYRALGGLWRIINLDHRMMTDELCRIAAEAGCPLSVWTVDKEEDIRRMMAFGVRNITTRRPLLALAIRRELFGV